MGALAADPADAGPAEMFELENGLQVVVVPDHRAPVVTHMVWYRVGAADDPPGKSGLAHYVEHLMYKETARIPSGGFARMVTRLGGRHNALTSHDTTSYFQRIPKQHLPTMMELEAERMVNLRFDPQEVLTERSVIQEERRASVDASPIALLNEQMLAQLYQNHPYRRPVLGWAHEMAALTLEDAAAFYARHYAPNNAVLVVAGDVTASDVRALAEATYGRIPRNPNIEERSRPREPEHRAGRSLRLEDARAGETALMLRYYHAPRPAADERRDAEALQLLTHILGGDDTSRLYRNLVLDRRIALQAGADYQHGSRDSGRLSFLVLAAPDIDETAATRALDAVISDVLAQGVTADELKRAKRAAEIARIYALDSTEAQARQAGETVTNGRSLSLVEEIRTRLEAVTLADVARIAADYLQITRSVTGVLARPRTAIPASNVSTQTVSAGSPRGQ